MRGFRSIYEKSLANLLNDFYQLLAIYLRASGNNATAGVILRSTGANETMVPLFIR